MKVLRKTEYRGCPVYALQFANAFQYLFIYGNEIWQHHAFYPRKWWRVIGEWLGVCDLYSEEDMAHGEEIILNGAINSIDALMEKNQSPRELVRRAEKRKQKSGNCVWQTTKSETGEGLYYCVTHEKFIPLKTDSPKHD